MPKPLNIAIIGAGLIGLSCADSLMRASGAGQIKITVFERRAAPMRGTSFCNSGMIHPSQSQSWANDDKRPDRADALTRAANHAVFDLALQSRALLQDNFKRLNLVDILERPKGCLQIYSDIQAAQQAQKNFDNFGVQSSILIDSVTTFGHPALMFPDDMSGNARLYGEALTDSLVSRGAIFIYEAEGLHLLPQNNGIVARLSPERPAMHLPPYFDHVIIAAGPQSSAIMARLGLSLQLEPIKGYAVNYARPDMDLPDVPVMDAASRSALTVFKDHIRVSGTWDKPDETYLLDRWRDIAPHLMEALGPPLLTWTGLRPVSRAGRPYISASSIPNLWVNTGHGHLGWTLCAGSGELMARMVLRGEADKRFIYAG